MELKINDPFRAFHYFKEQLEFTTGPVELDHLRSQTKKLNIIDVRAKEDFEEGHVPGAISLPEDDWGSFRGLAKDSLNVIYCYSEVCHLAKRAAVKFAFAGYPVMELDGGMKAWRESEREVEGKKSSAA